VGPSVVLNAAHVEVEVEEVDVTAAVQDDNQIRWIMMTGWMFVPLFLVVAGDTEPKMYPDIYGISKITTTSTQTKNGSTPPMEDNSLTREQKPVCNSPFVTRFSAFL